MKASQTILPLLAVFTGFAAAQTSYTISTFAGSGDVGFNEGRNRGDGGPVSAAQFDYPDRIQADLQGNLYVQVSTASYSSFVRKIDANGMINTPTQPPIFPMLLRPNGKLTFFLGYMGFQDLDPDGNLTSSGITLPSYPALYDIGSFAIASNGDLYLKGGSLYYQNGDDRYRYLTSPDKNVILTSAGKVVVYGSGLWQMNADRTFSSIAASVCILLAGPLPLRTDPCANDNLGKTIDGPKGTATVGGVLSAVADGMGNLIFVEHQTSQSVSYQLYPGDRPTSILAPETCKVRVLAPDLSIRTIAGSTCKLGGDGGPALQGGFEYPTDLTLDPNGNIYVADAGANRIRKLTPVVTAPKITGFAQGASYQLNQVAPGSVFTIFGQGLGPASLVTLQMADGKVATSLNGVRVLFGNVAAPLLYVSSGQISGLVPFGTNGQTSVNVQVDRAGSLSPAFPVTLAPAVPGFFSADSSGKGQAAALNQDNSINGSDHPTKAANVVSLYGTGFGLTSQTFEDGAIVASTANLQLPVHITVGGKEAQVLYAGAAPGAVAGVTQVNIVIPAGVSGHPEVQAKVGDALSPSGVTLTVQ